MAQLAIKGHPTRGKEVIQLLEMLGGIDYFNLTGAETDGFYYIYHDNNKIYHCLDINTENVIIYNLEGFEYKFPYKVGDKVTLDNKLCSITWMCWECNNMYYQVQGIDTRFTKKVTTNDLQPYKEETMEEKEDKPKAPILSNRYDYAEGKCGYVIPDGYEFDCIKEGFQTEIILRPIKPQYPKNYEDCCNVLMGKTDFSDFSLVLTKLSTNINEENSISPEPPYITSINNLYKLLICRDVYWKIAGMEMGLDKPWKPDYTNLIDLKYCIINNGFHIEVFNSYTPTNKILIFPTKEMRDAFFENFKELIKETKELL